MKIIRSLAIIALCSTTFPLALFAAEEESGQVVEDSSNGLPDAYAKNYLIATSTLSPDKKFAVMYPKTDSQEFPEGKDYLIALKPFAILGPLETKFPYFQHQSNGGLSAEWTEDSSVALVTLESKWGPGDIFLSEIHEGKLTRATNLLAKLDELLLPDFTSAKPKPEPFNDNFAFVFEEESEPICQLDGVRAVKINAAATNDPKALSDHPWGARINAVWDIAAAKFTEQKVSHEINDAAAGDD
ncbi:MAG: hypothetical protein QOI04_793 [Verrucomicrobiota bacterium]|jgi:hypothetical protein